MNGRFGFVVTAAAVSLALLPMASAAGATRARDSAEVESAGTWSTGVFNPLLYALTDKLQLRVHPVIFFLAPHGSLQVVHWQRGPWTLAGDYGLAIPWPAVKLLQGHLFPSFGRGEGEVGLALLPSVGVRLSHNSNQRVVTAKIDVAGRVPFTSSDLRPLEAPAPLEILFAPLLAGYRVRAGALWDAQVAEGWRLRAYVDLFVHGVDSDHRRSWLEHVTLRAGGGADWSWSARWRLAVGLVLWNANQFAVDERGRRHRSTDLLPVLDLIWSHPPARPSL
jgi:hypothetical protein